MRKFIDIISSSKALTESVIDLVDDLEPQILDQLWTDIDNVGSLDYQVSTIENYDPDNREFENSDPDGDPIPANSPEGKKLYRRAFNTLMSERIWDATCMISERFKDDKIWLFRVITAPRNWTPDPNRGPGIYWSWDREAADAHWGSFGDGNIKWLLTTQATQNQIDWPKTIAMNASPDYEEEKEIRLLTDAGVEFEWEEWKPGSRGW